jgi:hypothetical protein
MRSAQKAPLLAFLVAVWAITAAGLASADTIVLKNGRRIVAANVSEENGRVSYETSAGRLTLPKSIVERV